MTDIKSIFKIIPKFQMRYECFILFKFLKSVKIFLQILEKEVNFRDLCENIDNILVSKNYNILDFRIQTVYNSMSNDEIDIYRIDKFTNVNIKYIHS